MTNQTREITLTLAAETKGLDGIQQLRNEVRKLAKEGGDTAPEFQKLADELDKLAEQQDLINRLNQVQAEADGTAQAFNGAKEKAREFGQTLNDQRQKLAEVAAAYQTSNAQLDDARKAVDSANQSWREAKARLSELKAEAAQSGRATKEQADGMKVLRVEIAGYKAELDKARANVAALTPAQRDLKKEFDATGAAVAKSEAELRRIEAAAAKAEGEYQQLTEQVGQLSQKMEAAGGDAKNLAAAQATVATTIQRVTKEAQGLQTKLTETKATAAIVGNTLQNAFGVVGVRSADQIYAEIVAVNNALIQLAASSKVSGTEFDRAWAAGQAKLQKLKNELNNVANETDKVRSSAEGAAPALNQMAQAIAAAFTVDQFVEANKQMDSATRTLTALAGSAEGGAREMEYVKATAERLGLGLATASQQYASLIAATKESGISHEQARGTFEAVAGALSILGRSAADTEGALLALQQMASKGTVSMEELRQQIGDRIPGALPALARELGITDAELAKLVANGQLAAKEVFPALERSLKRTFKTDGQIESLQAQIERLKNSVTELFTAIGDTGIISASIEAIKVLVLGALQAFVSVKTVVRDIATLTAAWHETVRAIATLDFKALARNFETLRDVLADNAVQAEKDQQAVNKLAMSLAMNKDKAQAAAQANREVAGTAAQVSEGFSRIAVGINKLSDEYDRKIATQNAVVKATEEEVNASNKAAAAFSTEAERASVAAQGAQTLQFALQNLLATRQAEVSTLTEQRDRMLEYVKVSGDSSQAVLDSLTKLQAKITVSEQEVLTLRRQTAEQSALTASLRAQAEATRDNSSRVAELRASYEAARERAATLQKALAEGKATQDQVNAAELEAGRIKAVLVDAYRDQIDVAEANKRAKLADIDVEQAGIRLAIAKQQSIYEVARAQGREGDAALALIEIKRLEIKLAELTARAKAAEAEAARLAAIAKIEEMRATGEMTAAKQAEIAALEAGVKVKQIEAEIAGETAQRVRELADQFERSGGAAEGAAGGLQTYGDTADTTAGQVDRLTESMRQLNLQQQQQQGGGGLRKPDDVPKDRYGRPITNATSLLDQGNQTPKEIDFAAEAYRRGYSVEEVKLAQRYFGEFFEQNKASMLTGNLGGTDNAVRKINEAIADAIARGVERARGDMAGGTVANVSTEDLIARNLALVNWKMMGTESSGFNARARAIQSAGQEARERSDQYVPPKLYKVDVNIGGKTTRVNVAAQQDATALVTMLQELENASRRTF